MNAAEVRRLHFEAAARTAAGGFTVMELLVAMTISGIVMAMLVSHLLSMQQHYYEDVLRIEINSNLRSAMDIMSMNVRQAGENLQTTFPAVVVENGLLGSPDRLTLRRNLVPEVLSVCGDADTGDTAITVSSTSLSDPECLFTNVTPLFAVFDNDRTAAGGKIPAYVYDRIAKQGEFVEFSGGGTSGGEYYLSITPLSRSYPALISNIYLIEEYAFQLNSGSETLELVLDGDTATPQSVAFSVTDFQVSLLMDDGATLEALSAASSESWKDIRQIELSLSGSESRKDKTLSSTITARYFPRNVLSY